MLGGTTYEESRAVALLNQQLAGPSGGPGGTRILLGGSTVHNSSRLVYLPLPEQSDIKSGIDELGLLSFLDMVEKAAENYPPTIYNPPQSATSSISVNPPATSVQGTATVPPANGAAINLRAGGYELSVGGAGGSGLYRATGGANELGASFQIPQISEGIRDGAGRLWGNVRQKVEERVSRSATPQSGR